MKTTCTFFITGMALMLVFTLGFGYSGHAQQVIRIDDAIKQMVSSSDPDIVAQGQQLHSLVTDVQPSLYLTNGQMAAYGTEAPKVVYSDTQSLNMLYEGHLLYSQAELIKLTINSARDLPAVIDLMQLQGFPALKYIYIVFSYDACGEEKDTCLTSILEQVIQGAEIPVLCKLSILE